MPEQYEKIRDSLLARGKGEKAAKAEAAATYNKHHPSHPVGPHTDYAATTGVPVEFKAASAPRQVVTIYHKHRQEKLDDGAAEADAHRYAMRMVNHAGWYKAGRAWKQLAPDVRKKVQIREAVRQPDGRYVIEGVSVFYPNAVKSRGGKPVIFTAADIRRTIANTNRSIAAGAQKPGLTRGHPDPLINKAMDKQTPIYGVAVNWREDPDRRPGWAMCDLVDVDPSAVDDLKQRRLTGLSAGFAEDAGGLNERFGHVAMLGAESQALASLPSLDVFAASNQLCFSADSPTPFNVKGKIPMDRERAKQMADCYSAYSAALASFAAGEEGAEDKMKEFHATHGANLKGYAAEMDPAGDLSEVNKPVPGGAYGAAEGGSEETELPESPELTEAGTTHNSDQFSAEAHAAIQQRDTLIRKLTQLNQTLVGRQVRGDYEKRRDALLKDGHQFDAGEADKMFEACAEAKNPAGALERLFGFLAKTPRRESLAGIGTVFGAEASQPPARPGEGKAELSEQELNQTLEEMYNATGKNYDANDWKLGSAFSNMFAKR